MKTYYAVFYYDSREYERLGPFDKQTATDAANFMERTWADSGYYGYCLIEENFKE